MTEFCPNAKATILAIAGKIDHLHIMGIRNKWLI